MDIYRYNESMEWIDWGVVFLTLRLGIISATLLLGIAIPVAWSLAKYSFWGKGILESILALPLVLPPTVLGFYLLLMMGNQGVLGKISIFFTGSPLAFTFSGLVIGSIIYSFPFVVQPLKNAFENIPQLYLEVAATLGASPKDVFFSVVLPISKSSLLTAWTLGFAHTLGEFGVILMIGGNIADETRVLSIAIYDHVESLEYAKAHGLSAFTLILSFVLLLTIRQLGQKKPRI